MPKTGLTSEAIREKALRITEDKIRRFGFEKFYLTDIARELKVSHAALYNHFPDKAALLDAISERWLTHIDDELGRIAAKKSSPLKLIQAWFQKYHALKLEKVLKDIELFKCFNADLEIIKPYVGRHLQTVHGQLASLVNRAIATREIVKANPEKITDLLLEATMSFHHPRMVLERKGEKRAARLRDLVAVMLKGLR
jgi:AcrR family transcriptional regulator